METVEVNLPVYVVDFLSDVGRISGLGAGGVASVLLALVIYKEGSLQDAIDSSEDE